MMIIAHNLENSNPGTIMMLIYFICGTSTIRLQRDQSTRKAKSKGRVGEHSGLDCMHLHNSVQLIIGKSPLAVRLVFPNRALYIPLGMF
jgi:hypothetical protein